MVSKYGNPVATPDFNPINKWGRRPKPKPKVDHAFFCVSVERVVDKGREMVGFVGPFDGAKMLRDAIAHQIELGRERNWADPQVIRILK
jgi:hypothetical protein